MAHDALATAATMQPHLNLLRVKGFDARMMQDGTLEVIETVTDAAPVCEGDDAPISLILLDTPEDVSGFLIRRNAL